MFPRGFDPTPLVSQLWGQTTKLCCYFYSTTA
uniref:Uncharacterized protein n=1 Tax=Arundo donax TaxID=35708 RepID=A0A0A8Y5K1_ARUDO